MFLLTNAESFSFSISDIMTLKYFCELIQPLIILFMFFISMCILKNTEEELKYTNKQLEEIKKELNNKDNTEIL